MNNLLANRVAQPDLAALPEWQVAEILNAPDPTLPAIPTPFSCRSIAEPAVLSGELELLRIVARQKQIPADITPTGQSVALPTQALVAIGTLLDAVDRDLRVDPEVPGATSRVLAMFTVIENLGLLSANTKAQILAGTVRNPSWAEANNIEVTARSVGLARGGF